MSQNSEYLPANSLENAQETEYLPANSVENAQETETLNHIFLKKN